MAINWFPGHMVAAQKKAAEALADIDVVVEVLDARCPAASVNPKINAMREARQVEMLKKYDKDGDGKLSGEERKAMQAEMEAKRAAMLEKYDANKHGKLDPEEMKAARDAGEEIPWGGRGPGGQRGGKGEPKAEAPGE